jgi:hypothetical protein
MRKSVMDSEEVVGSGGKVIFVREIFFIEDHMSSNV